MSASPTAKGSHLLSRVAPVLLLLAGCGAPAAAPSLTAPPPPPQVQLIDDPRHLVIPSIGVMAQLVPLALLPNGELEAPADFSQVGWHRGGPEPGEPGPTVIAGHVDSRTGPAVFYRLADLRRGDEIGVFDDLGRAVSYRVDRVEQYPKQGFPAAEVYERTEGPSLRLITCGGDFDRRARYYSDNVVVFASVRP